MEELERFLSHNRRSSENTQKAYRHGIEMFFAHMNIKTIDDVLAINKKQVAEYVHVLSQKKTKYGEFISGSTVCTYLAPAEAFYGYLMKHDLISVNPVWRKMLELPRKEKKLFDVLVYDQRNGVDEVTPFLDACNTYRKRAMVLVFLSTGVRVSELCNLKLEDVRGNNISIRKAKWNEVREVYVSDEVIISLNKYIGEERVGGDYLFTTNQGNALNRANINRELKEMARACGLEKNITPHTLRRSCASLMAVDGISMSVIQNTLGHTTMAMTNHYVGDIKEHRKSQVIDTMGRVFGDCGRWVKNNI